MAKLPQVMGWIDDLLVHHATDARFAIELPFLRLPLFYSQELLSRSKVVVVDRVPSPPLSALGLKEFSSFEQMEKGGITLKDTYFVNKTTVYDESTHFHELVHIIQWEHFGADRFVMEYAKGLLEHQDTDCPLNAYLNCPLEKVAFDLQREFDSGCSPFNVEMRVRKDLDKQFV